MTTGETTAGRNDPCPCGSGLKHKNCCLPKSAPAQAAAPRLSPTGAKRLREANACKAKRDLAKAEQLFRQVLATSPNEPAAIGGLGHTLALMGREAEGIAMLREVVDAEGTPAELRLNLAQALYQSMQAGEALACCERVIEASPRQAAAHTLAAKCLERLNRIDEAVRHAERAVSLARTDPHATLTLAKLEARQKNYDSARDRLKRLIARSSTPPDLHHQALTELGFVLDKRGEYDAAFDAFTRAGEEIAATPAVRAMNRRVAYQKLDMYRDRLPGELLGRFGGESFDTPAPAFLVGFPRSGTTMTEQVLAAHPGVMTTEEEPLIVAVGQKLMAGAGNKLDVPAQLERLDSERVAQLRRSYWQRARETLAGDVGDRLLVDKLPLNIVDLGMINVIFPDARLLVALRDPRDVCLSCFMQWFAPNPAMIQLLSLPSAADFYAAVMGLYLHLRPRLTMPWLQVRYEDTVTDLESQARRIIEHMGLEWSDELLSFHERASERFIRTPSYAAVTERVHTRAVGRWRNYARHFEALQARLRPFVEEFGYEQA